MNSGWKCTVCGHVSPDGFGSCEGCMEKEIQRLTKESERLRFENDLLKENQRRDGGLRDSENAWEDMK